jgi:hypothetical protein
VPASATIAGGHFLQLHSAVGPGRRLGARALRAWRPTERHQAGRCAQLLPAVPQAWMQVRGFESSVKRRNGHVSCAAHRRTNRVDRHSSDTNGGRCRD